MKIIEHDPSEYIKGLQQVLISDKKRIGFLFGAGTSMAQKNEKSLTVPAIIKLTEGIVDEISNLRDELKNALESIKKELVDSNQNFDIESILSSLEQKHEIIGAGTLNGLNITGIKDLIDLFKQKVVEKVSVHNSATSENLGDLVQTDFAHWIRQADRKHAIEIFTTNYDYLFELGLEYKDVPYYDGFSGSYQPFFYSDSIEDISFMPTITKLWKIHGSLGWHFEENSGKIIRTHPDEKDIIIYPSILKYRDSKKQPYISLMDRLSNFLRLDDSVLITCGYSFNDEHINERILSAVKSNAVSHIFVLNFGDIKDNDELYGQALNNGKISAYGFKDAIIGCKYGNWKLKEEPDKEDTPNVNLYFDEDAPISESEKLKKEIKSGGIWTGEGKFILPDFLKLVGFLQSMIPESEIYS